jgi:hypothetical protein
MKKGAGRTKLVTTSLRPLCLLLLVIENIDLILSPFHRENHREKGPLRIILFGSFLERSHPPVSDRHVVFIFWLLVIPIMSILSCRFVCFNILVKSELLCPALFFLIAKWASHPSFY